MINTVERSPVRSRAEIDARKPALKAYGMFIKVSMECPASTVAQGAKIAEYCKVAGDDPIDLMEALLVDEPLLDKLVERANITHLQRGARIKRLVDRSEIEIIITEDFKYQAWYTMNLQMSQIKKLSALYHQNARSRRKIRQVREKMLSDYYDKKSK